MMKYHTINLAIIRGLSRLSYSRSTSLSNFRGHNDLAVASDNHSVFQHAKFRPKCKVLALDIRFKHDQNSTKERNEQFEVSQIGVRHRRSKLRSIVELMRWDKPTGTILALTPSLWAVGLTTPESSAIPDLKTAAIFTCGAIAARGMGCTLNDLLDRKFDRLVERTKMRPIACGDITPKEGLLYLAIQSTIGLGILCLNNLQVIQLGLFSGVMISVYPLFKRFTYWPQIMLALTMNWGVLMGYAAIKGTIELEDLWTLLPLYLGSCFWTMYYDTIYAHQDKTDDAFIGVKSSALKLGSSTKSFLNQMIACTVISLSLAGSMTGQLWPYYLSVGSAGLIQANQVRKLDIDNPEICWRSFDQQKYIGLLVLIGVLGSVALKEKSARELREKERIDEIH